MTSCYFQAILGVFLRLSGARHYGEALHRIAAADAGRRAFAFVQRHLCWCSLQTVLAGGRRAGAAQKFLRRPCAPFAPHFQLPGPPQWPHWWALHSWAGAGGA